MPPKEVEGVKEDSCQPTKTPGHVIRVGRKQSIPLHQSQLAEGADLVVVDLVM